MASVLFSLGEFRGAVRTDIKLSHSSSFSHQSGIKADRCGSSISAVFVLCGSIERIHKTAWFVERILLNTIKNSLAVNEILHCHCHHHHRRRRRRRHHHHRRHRH